MSQILIFDTTLRDGEQSPGATMMLTEKIAIAEWLERLGVDVIEAGFAAASPGDLACVQEIARRLKTTTVCSLARAVRGDIEAAAKALEKAHKPRIHTFISTSAIHIEHQLKTTPDRVLEIIEATVSYARSLCDDVEWSAMDATRSDPVFLTQAVTVAIKAGATTINLPDTVGYTMPEEYFHLVKLLVTAFPQVCFSAHCHNDLGMATANSLAAIQAGARQIECTINGIGERAGNTAMEEVVMALKTRPDIFNVETHIDTKQIYPLSRFVSAITGFPVQKNKAIVGANAFAHESGIHQDGMIKNRQTYEIMSPEMVGITESKIVLGKHSGRAALKSKIADWGFALSDGEFEQCFEAFKGLCDRKKEVSEEDVLSIICDHVHTSHAPFIHLTAFGIHQDAHGLYSADVTLEIEGIAKRITLQSDGPLAAIFQAINHLLQIDAQVENYELHSISAGSDAQAESTITLRYKGRLWTGHARHTDTVMTGAKAYLSAINKIMSKQGGDHAG